MNVITVEMTVIRMGPVSMYLAVTTVNVIRDLLEVVKFAKVIEKPSWYNIATKYSKHLNTRIVTMHSGYYTLASSSYEQQHGG